MRRPPARLLGDAERWLGLARAELTSGRDRSLGPAVVTEADERARRLLYEVLNALDAKAGTLMRFNGLVSATMVLLLNPTLAQGLKFRALFLLSFLAAIGAEVACFFIFAVNYRFLRHDGDTGRELVALARAAENRQRLFWAAWGLTFAATLLLVAGVVLNAVKHLP